MMIPSRNINKRKGIDGGQFNTRRCLLGGDSAALVNPNFRCQIGGIALLIVLVSSIFDSIQLVSGTKESFHQAEKLLESVLSCIDQDPTSMQRYDNKPNNFKKSQEDCFKKGFLLDFRNLMKEAHKSELDNERLSNENKQLILNYDSARKEAYADFEFKTKEFQQVLDEHKRIAEEETRLVQDMQNRLEGQRIQIEVLILEIGGKQKVIQNHVEEIKRLESLLDSTKYEVSALQNETASNVIALNTQLSEINLTKQENTQLRGEADALQREMTWSKTYASSKVFTAIDLTCEKMIHVLIQLGANINATNYKSESFLHRAALSKDKAFSLKIIPFFILSGAPVHSKDEEGYTFLHRLVDDRTTITPNQFHEMAAYLIAKNLSSLFDSEGDTARTFVSGGWYSKFNGSTPFQLAVKNVELEKRTLVLLLKNGVNLNAVNSNGDSILFYALMGNRSQELVSSLVELGVNPQHLNKDNSTLLHLAAILGTVEHLDLFLKLGLEINAMDDMGLTPLHRVVYNGVESVFEKAKFLIDNGANIKTKDTVGDTPLVDAVKRIDVVDREKLVDLLMYYQ